jgi:ketosteroid isomerase-like protein
MDARDALARLEAVFTGLTPATVAEVALCYTDDARFKDPFNDVRGGPAIARIFAHMFEQLDSPRFEILDRTVDGDRAWLTWNLEYRLRAGQPVRRIHGASHLRFDADGRVSYHRDYWDTAEELYESIPLLGAVLRMIRRRLGAS